MWRSLALSFGLVAGIAGVLGAQARPIPDAFGSTGEYAVDTTTALTVDGDRNETADPRLAFGFAIPDANGVDLGTPLPGGGAPPWGIGEVTTSSLTPEQFRAALPCQFGGYTLASGLATTTPETQLYPFAVEGETYRYYAGPKPVDIPYAVVNVSTLPADLTPAAALAQIRDRGPSTPFFEIDQEDLSPDAAVPFLLVRQYGGEAAGIVPVLIWGANGGHWLFTVSAYKPGDLETLVRLLVENLSHGEDAAATPSAEVGTCSA
jgi:hypothetical protein